MVFILYLFLLGLAAAQPTPPSSTDTPAPPFVPICDPTDFTTLPDLPIPSLPDQFSFTVELSVTDINTTGVVAYYYDGPGNRGRFEIQFKYNERPAKQTFILDYNLGEIFNVSFGDCTVYAIADDPLILNSTFGINLQNGSSHIGAPFIQRVTSDVPSRYVGEEFIRGIRAQHWQDCRVDDFHNDLNDYYFVAKDWDYAGQGQLLDINTQMVPIQLAMSTRFSDGTGDYRIYSFMDFRAGPDSVPDSLFRVPNGLACTGRFPGQPVPQVPQFFSTYVQLVSTGFPPPTVQTFKVR